MKLERRARICALFLASAVLLAAGACMAADECFLWLDNIRGASKAARYLNWIDLADWALEEPADTSSTTGTAVGTTAGGRARYELRITKLLDIATPGIQRRHHSGERIGRAQLECRKAGKNDPYLKIAFDVVQVRDVNDQFSLPKNISVPVETAVLIFSRMRMEVLTLGPDGTPGGPVEKVDWDYQAKKSMTTQGPTPTPVK